MGWLHRHRDTELAAWHTYAVEVYRWLALGGRPEPTWPVGTRLTEPVFLDTRMGYACHYGLDVVTQQVVQIVPLQLGPMLAWAALARAQARRTAERAAAWAAPQWRDHAPARVLVTQTATWCQVHGAWQSFAHTDLTRYWLHPDTTTDTHTDAVVLESGQWAPRALTGPAAWTHAVLLAYLHPMGEDWRDAPWLGPVRDRLREP